MSSQQITKFIFWPLELAVVLLICVNAYFIFNTSYDKALFYKYGAALGVIAFWMFILVLLPGMLMRYGFKGKLVRVLFVYRREFGKLMFLFASAHYLTIQVFPMIQAQNLPTFHLYEIMSLIALALALPLFISSTNWAQKKLGKWWKKLHSLVYIFSCCFGRRLELYFVLHFSCCSSRINVFDKLSFHPTQFRP